MQKDDKVLSLMLKLSKTSGTETAEYASQSHKVLSHTLEIFPGLNLAESSEYNSLAKAIQFRATP